MVVRSIGRIGRWRLLALLAIAACIAGVGAGTAQAAARSILVHFTNNSDSVLTLAGGTLDHGCWTDGIAPPAQIAIGQSLDIGSESCGVATGTEFHVDYRLANGAVMEMHYDDPFIGSNSYEETTPVGYSFARSGGDGNNAELTVGFGCDSATCDGIPDDWKKNGVTIDPGGGNPPQFVDLPKMGVSLDRPNVLVQLDWMADATHNQQLSQTAIDNVIRAFDQDPVTYRGATRSGITLIVDAGPNSTITPGGAKWGGLSRAQSIPWSADFLTGSRSAGYQEKAFYDLLKSNFVPTGRLPIFHYAVAASEIASGDSTSGLTLDDKLGFMVTLGDWTGGVGSTNEQNGTFMHELGHDLGLRHGGQDDVNYKPNYPSIMNYIFQTVGVPRGGARVFDYSRDDTQDVDETKLTEAGGVGFGANPSGYGTGHACPGKDAKGNPITNVFSQDALSPVDWSCDGVATTGGTGFDANADGSQNVLKGSTSDWGRIQFKTGGVGQGANAKDTVSIPDAGVSAPSDELTFEMARRIRTLPLGTTLTYTGATNGDYDDPVTVSAKLADTGVDHAPAVGRTVSFRIGSSPADACSAVTDSTGTASCAITITQDPASSVVSASFGGDAIYRSASTSAFFTILQEETAVAYSGALTSHYHDAFTATATLTDPDGGAPISGKPLTFTLGGTDSCSATTDGSGVATCSIVATQPSGNVTLVASFAGDVDYVPGSASPSFAITPEETTTTYVGPTVILKGASGVTLAAQLVEDGPGDDDGDGGSAAPVPANRLVTLSLGGQSCVGATDATGYASCTLVFAGPLGPQPLAATFPGDAYYAPSADTTKTAIVFAFPSRGAFVVGDRSTAPGASVTWWSSRWSTLAGLSGGVAPSAFKGFAATVTSLPTTSPANVCGTTFTTRPGDSPPPTADVPSYMGVIVAGSVTSSDSSIGGTWGSIVVVKTDGGYAPDPGHVGTGTVVATFCP